MAETNESDKDRERKERREYRDIDRTEAYSYCALLLVIGGCIAVAIASKTNIYLIAGGYTAVAIGSIGSGALHGHALIMSREQRHYREIRCELNELRTDLVEMRSQIVGIRELLNENKALLADTSIRDLVVSTLERIEATQQWEIKTLGGAFNDDIAERRRNHR